MRRVVVLGAGKIGSTIADVLGASGDYEVVVADCSQAALQRLDAAAPISRRQVDVNAPADLAALAEGAFAVLSAAPYHLTAQIARAAQQAHAHYLDLTEDVAATRIVKDLAQGAATAFIPQCGLAPGFISIAAHDLTTRFDSLLDVKMGVGALPQFPSNALNYNLTWSTDGLINEYCEPCEAIVGGVLRQTQPLEDLEQFALDGVVYEAFNTSGGLGTLCETLAGRVRNLSYRTIRYPGHAAIMKALLNDLRLRERRDVLKDILENALPATLQDVVIVYASVSGERAGRLVQETYAQKIYAASLQGQLRSAIQLTTASAICAVLDLLVEGAIPQSGFVRQEEVALQAFLNNRFGRVYAPGDHDPGRGLRMDMTPIESPSDTRSAAELLQRLGVPAALHTGGARAVRSPITGETIAAVHDATPAEVAAGVERAHRAFLVWRDKPAPRRGDLIRLFGEELRAAKSDLAALVTLEVGKIISEANGEVQEMIDICDYAVGLSRQLFGLTLATERPDHRMMETWHPLGVVGIISAFNFPVAVWSWNAALAIVCGDACVWKPSEKTPLTALAVQALFERACDRFGEAPEGLSTVVIGARAVGEALVEHPKVPLVSATGSTAMGRAVGPRLAQRFARALLELGGNNAAIIAPSADLHLALRGVAFAAMGTAGQRCTSLRRLFVHESRYDEFVPRLRAAYASVPVGDPRREATLVGPLIDEAAFALMQSALADARTAGGQVTGGERVESPPGAFYVRPALVETPGQVEVVKRETFAPILYVMRYRELDEAIALQNDAPQGLSSSIFTNDMREAELFISARGSDCGIANVNIGPSGAEIGGAFGGEKETGGGREAGSDSWRAYMRRATNTLNYGRTLPLAQGVRFDL